jgi:hypothetical protein
VSVDEITDRGGCGPRSVFPELLDHLSFTDHAIDRFASRAGLATSSRRIIEPVICDLLLQEGLVVPERPHWARSRNTADLYLQLGEWMLFIGCRRGPPSRDYAIVTVVNGPSENTWQSALRRQFIFTPPPVIAGGRRKSGLLANVGVMLNHRRHAWARKRARRKHLARYRLR